MSRLISNKTWKPYTDSVVITMDKPTEDNDDDKNGNPIRKEVWRIDFFFGKNKNELLWFCSICFKIDILNAKMDKL